MKVFNNVFASIYRGFFKIKDLFCKSKELRIVTGLAFTITSIAMITCYKLEALGPEKHILGAATVGLLFGLGLYLITNDIYKVQAIIDRAIKEVTLLLVPVTTSHYVLTHHGSIDGLSGMLIVYVAVVSVLWYLMRTFLTISRFAKKAVIFLKKIFAILRKAFEKTDGKTAEQLEKTTKSMDKVFENLISIAGKLAIAYGFLSKVAGLFGIHV